MTKGAPVLRRRSLLALSLVFALVTAWSGAPTGASTLGMGAGGMSAGVPTGTPVTVMTRNIYVGADITKPVTAARGRTGTALRLALGHANYELRTTVDRTRFPARAGLLADELAETRPDLVGLQEVALWRSGPLELGKLGVPNATTVDYDFLAILLNALRQRGIDYAVASAEQETDVEAPSFLGDPTNGTATDARDVRLSVSDVVLVRRHSGARVTARGGAQYRARVTLDAALGGIPLSIVRGYAWADVRAGSQRFRFVTTHLESASSDLALAQVTELMTALRRVPAKTILACDCNSDPLDGTVRASDHVPHLAAYRLVTSSGFTDQWLQLPHPSGPGFTSGLSELVDDPTADGFRRRIDMVFSRNAVVGQSRHRSSVTAQRGHLTGDQVADRDATSGLWASDHAGVVLRLRLH